MKILDHSQLVDWGLAGPVFLHWPLLKLSPNVSRLAMATGSTILAFDLEPTGADLLGSPAKRVQIEGNVIVALEWGPEENTLAALVAAPDGLTLRVVDLERGVSRILTEDVAQPQGTDSDVLGLVNTVSWVP